MFVMLTNETTATLTEFTSSIFVTNKDERQTTIQSLFVLLRKFDKTELDEAEVKASSWLFYLLESLVEDEIKSPKDLE